MGHGRPRHRNPDEVAPHLDYVATAVLVELIRRQAGAGRPVTFVLANLFATWEFAAAAAMGVLATMLWMQSCMVLSLYYHYLPRAVPPLCLVSGRAGAMPSSVRILLA
jgi:hypothetical protein